MTPEEWIGNQPKFKSLVEEALNNLNANMDALYIELYGEPPVRCRRCNRILVPRRIWYVIPVPERYSGFEPVGKENEGHSCRITNRRSERPGLLPDLEVSRLRALVGFTVNGRKVG